jgi:hypothetical protein
VCDQLSTLHDPNDCRLGLEFPVRRNSLMRRLVFLLRLLELDLVDLNPYLLVVEAGVKLKRVVVVDLLTLWSLG